MIPTECAGFLPWNLIESLLADGLLTDKTQAVTRFLQACPSAIDGIQPCSELFFGGFTRG